MTTLAWPSPTSATADTPTTSLMHALVYHGPDTKSWEEVPKPTLIDDASRR